MGRRWRDFVEGLLPWFDPDTETHRNRVTEAIRRRSITARIRSERVISEYEQADDAARGKGQLMIDELRRDDDQ